MLNNILLHVDGQKIICSILLAAEKSRDDPSTLSAKRCGL